jgi:[mitogen-activated protein kinase] kinase 5
MVPKRDNLQAVKVHQIDKDAIVVCYENIVQIVNLQGVPKQSKKYASHLNFEFNVEGIGEIFYMVLKFTIINFYNFSIDLVCLPDSILAFHKHGMTGKSLRNGEITQEINDPSRVYNLIGSDK